jgi:hypothetical protein
MVRALERRGVDRPLQYLPALMIAFFWVLQFATLTAQRMLMGEGDTRQYLLPRLLAACVGSLISILILKLHQRQSGKPLTLRALTALLASVVASLAHAAVNFLIFELFFGQENERTATLESYLNAVTFWFWCYFALSCLLLALVYSRELSEREREFAQLERLAQAAQLKALRYQLNPHFMFNTLNSIAALICTGENEIAERMVEGLGDFLRATLEIDPHEDHALDREIELQKLYLGIERLRFPQRLSFRLDVDPQTSTALVPSLILQPLTENAIKHCVAVSSSQTELVISSQIHSRRLVVCVTNSPPVGATRRTGGTSVGLGNVEERLRARFGDAQRFQFGKLADGSFQVRMEIPLSFSS